MGISKERERYLTAFMNQMLKRALACFTHLPTSMAVDFRAASTGACCSESYSTPCYFVPRV